MRVQLISFTPDPELLSAAAARLCYRDVSAVDILHNLTQDEVKQLLDIVLSSGHHSVIEHISFTFAIDGASRILTHQIVRHRVGIAFSQQSQRFTSVHNAGYVTPATISSIPELNLKYEKLMASCFTLYQELKAQDIPNEDARYVLPQAIMTRLVMTVNMRQLLHMYSINACFRTQWEFRQLMGLIKKEMYQISPRLAQELKIKCFSVGYCSEQSMCKELEGKMPRKEDLIRENEKFNEEFYSNLAAKTNTDI